MGYVQQYGNSFSNNFSTLHCFSMMASNTIEKVVSVTVFTAPEVSNCTIQVISSVFQDCPQASSLTVLAKLAECTTSSFEPQSFSASAVPCGQCRIGAVMCSQGATLAAKLWSSSAWYRPPTSSSTQNWVTFPDTAVNSKHNQDSE